MYGKEAVIRRAWEDQVKTDMNCWQRGVRSQKSAWGVNITVRSVSIRADWKLVLVLKSLRVQEDLGSRNC